MKKTRVLIASIIVCLATVFAMKSNSNLFLLSRNNIAVLTQGELVDDETKPICYFNYDDPSIWRNDSYILICVDAETGETCKTLFCHNVSNTYHCAF